MHTSCSKQLSYSFLGPFRHFFMLPPILVNSTNDRSPEFWPLTSNDLRLASNFACSVESGANLCIPNFIQFREKKISGLVWFVLIIKVDLPIPLMKKNWHFSLFVWNHYTFKLEYFFLAVFKTLLVNLIDTWKTKVIPLVQFVPALSPSKYVWKLIVLKEHLEVKVKVRNIWIWNLFFICHAKIINED